MGYQAGFGGEARRKLALVVVERGCVLRVVRRGHVTCLIREGRGAQVGDGCRG